MPAQHLAAGVVGLLLVLPWVQPFSSGPDPSAWSWLISAACLAGLVLLRRHLSLRWVAQALLAAALISSAMAVLQYLGLAQQLPGVWPAGPGEGLGNLRQRNQMGSLSAMGLAALLAWLASARRTEPPAWPAIAALAAFLLLAAGNAASQSRTGLLAWLAVALLGCWFAWTRQRRGLALAVLALLLPLLAALACTGVGCGAIGRLAHAGQDSRLLLWRNVLSLIAERPWTGWGWGELDYAHFITLYPGPRFGEKLGHAHNLPLHLAVELGLPAALLVCVAVGVWVWRRRPWAEQQPWRWLAWGVLGVIALHSLLEHPLWFGPFQISALLCTACLWTAGPAVASAPPGRPSRSVDAAALLLLAGLAWAALDYARVSQPFLPAAQRASWWAHDPLGEARRSVWYGGQADFARLALTPLSPANAGDMHALALQLLHFSPEPLVIARLLDSCRLLGHSEELAFYAQRFQAAYPKEHQAWLARQPGP